MIRFPAPLGPETVSLEWYTDPPLLYSPFPAQTGSRIVKAVLPPPGRLSTSTLPWWPSTMP